MFHNVWQSNKHVILYGLSVLLKTDLACKMFVVQVEPFYALIK